MVNDEAWVGELREQIGARTRISYRTPSPPTGVLDPVSLAREAIDWLLDARAFDARRLTAWSQLVTDLNLALAEVGPALRSQLAPTVAAIAPLLQLTRGAGDRERRLATKALEELLASLDTGGAAVAAWHDLIAAYQDVAVSPETCDLRESQLAAVARLRGLDWTFLPGQLGRTLAGYGDLIEGYVDRATRVREPTDNRPLSDRQTTCDTYLWKEPDVADVVVWVAISELSIWRWMIELERITFYDGRWWSSVVEAGAGQLPAELAGRDQLELNMLFHGLLNRKVEEEPFVVARVELERCRVPAAVEQAQLIAQGVLHAAGLRSGELTGVPFRGGVAFAGNEVGAGDGFSLDSDFASARKERVDDKAVGRALRTIEPELVKGLIAGDQRLALALTAVEWLKETKGLTPSQQLGLSLRALEQVVAEVEERHWQEIVYERL